MGLTGNGLRGVCKVDLPFLRRKSGRGLPASDRSTSSRTSATMT
jgi:hypothetical protein